MKRGRFITFEGGEGVGKSTQTQMLADALKTRGVPLVVTREPGGTPGAEAIRDMLLHPPGEGWEPRAEVLLFAAARADHVSRLIEPALAEGRWVICDRFVDSSRAYQGGEGGLGDDDILTLHSIGSADLRPDKVIVLTAEPDTAALRLSERGEDGDSIERRSPQYHARVADRFAELASREPGRYAIIRTDCEPEETHRRILDTLAPLFEEAA